MTAFSGGSRNSIFSCRPGRIETSTGPNRRKASMTSSTRTSGEVRIMKDLDVPIEGRDILVVEDIVDTGLTLSYLLANLKSRGAASVKLVALLDKFERREKEVPIDYLGFQIPDEFVVGYGLDFAERYRNLPFIAVLKNPEA